MDVDAGAFLFEDAGSVIERQDVGEDIMIMCRGLGVASFRRGDGVGRDVAIASLLRLGLGLKTDAVAELCGASHGWVCDVRARLKEGGMESVIARGKRGRRRRIVGRTEDTLREMRAAGATLGDIAKALGVSESLVSLEVKRHGLPRGDAKKGPMSLPGVGAGGAPKGKRVPRVRSEEGLPVAAKANESAPPSVPPLESSHVDELPEALAGGEVSSAANGDLREQGGGDEEFAAEENDVPPTIGSNAANGAEPPLEKRVCEERGTVGTDPEGEAGTTTSTIAARDEASPTSDELMPGARIPSGPAEHPCRYAGTLLLWAAAAVIGVDTALRKALAVRPKGSVYDALQVVLAMMASWVSGYGSLEAMHERDARALGVVLGLERSPSVRTLYRAIMQIGAVFDPVALTTALMQGVLSARLPERLWFGVDSHFKTYSGDAPIDKGWDSKRRIAVKGIADVFVTDERGWTWHMQPVPAGSPLSKHLLTVARTVRGVVGDARPLAFAFDRGGFDFDELDAMHREGFFYVGYVPGSVTLPDLASIAPEKDGVGEVLWTHPRLHHPARLLVERDGKDLVPVVTNLPTLVDTEEVMRGLRDRRGAQENSFKAARAFTHIDHLVDRGGASYAPDDRLIPNPVRKALKETREELRDRKETLKNEPVGERSRHEINSDMFRTEVDALGVERELREVPAKVPRVSIEPDAERATLKTKNRLLLQPLKLAADNARRWLLGTLGSALAPSDHPDDQDALCRSLLALLQAPGSVRFEDDRVVVTLELPLPPAPHARLAAAIEALDRQSLRFSDERRRVQFRLAPRPTRASLPSAVAGRT
jgi:hypothetical protein